MGAGLAVASHRVPTQFLAYETIGRRIPPYLSINIKRYAYGRTTKVMAWGIVGRKSQTPQQVTTGSFELERDGQVASLEYSMTGKVLGLIHTEVPTTLRGLGLASSLAEIALQYARKNNLKVDVICPSVQEYIAKHPEYSDLVLR
jgi:predicted GNAT family acetyltransferase